MGHLDTRRHELPHVCGLAAPFVAAVLAAVLGWNPPAGAAEGTPAASIESVVDRVVDRLMREGQVPGAAVVLVKDDKVVISKGYGFADVGRRIRVDPHTTMFAVASLSKPFTALTALTYARVGTLPLDGDVRGLTQFDLRRRFPARVTVGHLLTHTSGFDDEEIGDSARHAEDLEPLARYLARRMPPQVLPPGSQVKYSNHGAALVGHLIETVSGKPFDRAVKDAVFDPLGMAASSFSHTVSPGLDAMRATGYVAHGDSLESLPRYFSRVAPAWGMATTAEDMSRFLLAQTDRAGLSALAPAIRDMHLARYRPHPMLPGVTFGLFEADINGQHVLYHEGGMSGFSSYLLVLPEQRLGLFVTQNLRSGDLRRAVTTAVMDHYFPAPPVPPARRIDVPDLKPYAGTYRFNRNYYEHSFMKSLPLLGVTDEIRVSVEGDHLLIGNYPGIPVARDVFRGRNAAVSTAFRRDGDDAVSVLHLGLVPLAAYNRVAWYETGLFHRLVLGAACLVFLSDLLAAAVRHIRKASPGAMAASRHEWDVRLGLLTSTVYLAFILCLGIAFATAEEWLQFGPPAIFRMALGVGIIAAAATAVAIGASVWTWRRAGFSPRMAWRLFPVPAAGAAASASLAYWHLLGFWF